MKLKVGDIVACYLTNTTEYEKLLQWGMVLEINESIGDILVLDNHGHQRWWPERRWRKAELENS